MAKVQSVQPAKAAPSTPTPASISTSSGRKKASYEKDLDAGRCNVTLPSGHSFSFTLGGVSQGLHKRLAFHGLVQKVMDAAAGERGADAIDSMKLAYDQLTRGVWTERVKVDPAIRRQRIAAAIVQVFAGAYAKKFPGKTMTSTVALAYPAKVFNKLARDPRVQQALGKALADAESVL